MATRMSETFSLGVLDLVPRLNDATAEQALQQSVTLAQHAEAWGYARYWTSEHHDMAELASASPEVLLSHIGARTTTIQLGSGAVLLPHYSPLKVAESFRLLAALYPGRAGARTCSWRWTSCDHGTQWQLLATCVQAA